jgi:iron complex outermembrane receptor protein
MKLSPVNRVCRQAVLAALATLSAGIVHAQDARLSEVKVTAQSEGAPLTLTAPGMDVARQRIEKTPGGVDLIDADTYKTGRTSTLQDALSNSPGVYVQSRFGAEETRISIRGSGIQRTFHGRGIKVMQDGVPVNLADGSFDMQSLEPLAARYVEVWRGANALQYGASTLGGAINFVSPTGYDTDKFRARAEAGSFDYRRAQVAGGGVMGSVDGFVSASTFSQEGFRRHANQEGNRLVGNVGWRINSDIESRLYFAHATSDSELPGSLTKAQMQADPRQANAGNITGNQKRNTEVNRIANKTTFRLSDDSRIEASAFYSAKSLFHPIFQVIDQDSDDYGVELRFVSNASLGGRRNIFTAGISPTWGTVNERRSVNVKGKRGAPTLTDEQKARNLDVYLENQHYLTNELALVVGAQATEARRRLDVSYSASKADRSFDRTFNGVSPKIGARYELSKDVQLFTNLSRSFEPPSFGEMSTTLTTVTANLKPQTATTLEFGTRGQMQKMQWDATYYYAKVNDELLTYNLGGGLSSTVNANKTRHQGVELGATWALLPGLELREVYMWNDFRFENDPAYGNNRLAGIPVQLSRTELTWRSSQGFYLSGNVEWSPQRFAIDQANTFFADSYTVWGLKAGRQVAKDLSFFVEGRNLSNKTYASTTGVIVNAGGKDQSQFNPGDGRAVYAGIEWRM